MTDKNAIIQKAIDNNIVAIDNGYSDQKIAQWVKNGEKFELRQQKYPSRAEFGSTFMELDGGSDVGVYEFDGVDFTVASNVLNPITTKGASYSTSDLNTVLVNHSLIMAEMSGKEVFLGTGLPFNDYFVNGEKNEELIEKIRNKVKEPISPKACEPAKIIQHELFPESTAAFFDYAINMDTFDMMTPEYGVAVIDMGGYTTDISYLDPGIKLNKELSGTAKIGVLSILDELENELKRELKTSSIRRDMVEQALMTGKIKVLKQEKDISALVTKSKRTTAKKLSSFVDSTLEDQKFVDALLFVGGGAALLAEEFKRERENVEIPKDPQFANVRGMLKYMTFMQG